jgi:hypothetical protein
MSRRGSPASTTCPHPRWCGAAATTPADAAHAVACGPDAAASAGAPCTTWATCWPAVPSTCCSPTPSTSAPTATGVSQRICPTWPCPSATTANASRTWRCVCSPPGAREDGLPYRSASWHLWRDHRVFVPYATIQNWVEAAGEKKSGQSADHVSGRGPGRLQRLPGHRRGLRRPLLRAQCR